MSDEDNELEDKTPKIGDVVLWTDDDDELRESYIEEVHDFDDAKGLFGVSTEDGPFSVYWSAEDENWVHSEE